MQYCLQRKTVTANTPLPIFENSREISWISRQPRPGTSDTKSVQCTTELYIPFKTFRLMYHRQRRITVSGSGVYESILPAGTSMRAHMDCIRWCLVAGIMNAQVARMACAA
jgi:hypothetical protein